MAAPLAQDDFVSEINVTPFVDVMLVLLIIFMVTAPMMTEGLGVDLPKVEASEILPTEDDHMILTVTAAGMLYLDTYESSLVDLPRVLEVHVRNSGRQLFVRADATVPYGTVMEVMGKIRGVGITNVGLVTLPAAESGAKGQAALDTQRPVEKTAFQAPAGVALPTGAGG